MSVPAVPIIVMVTAAIGVVELVVIVAVELQVGKHDDCEKLIVVPAGKPEAVNTTAVAEPDAKVAVMDWVILAACFTPLAPPLLKEKSKAGACVVAETEVVTAELFPAAS